MWSADESAVVTGKGNLGLQFLVLLGVIAVLLAGCIRPPSDRSTAAEQTANTRLTLSKASTNRLVVLGEDGNVFTIAPDGSERLDLTRDANRQHFYAQPTWAPASDRIAWVEIDLQGETSALLTSAADGTHRTRADVPFPPFYLNWSPNSQQLAYLSNWASGSDRSIALRLLDLTKGGAETKTIGMGRPFYFSWSPDSQELLTHIDNAKVSRMTLDGKETILAPKSTNFATPQWYDDGQKLLYGVDKENTPQLVLADLTGAIKQVVTFFKAETTTAFSLSPNGKYIAYTETDVQVGTNSLGPLYVFDVGSEEFEQLSRDPVLAFFWNPGGDKLLFMSAELAGRQVWLHLNVWDGKKSRELSRFRPSEALLGQYLPFADQYAQSMRVWSPDGKAVVFAGEDDQGNTGIFVQPLDAPKPTRIAPGIFAAWSPE